MSKEDQEKDNDSGNKPKIVLKPTIQNEHSQQPLSKGRRAQAFVKDSEKSSKTSEDKKEK
ncbi:MAG: hypothetical protein Q8J69_04090 [Sphingobacteriaceae bacterium]|nr:hypothetical protein [Sphingobacteriaceae bacterium]